MVNFRVSSWRRAKNWEGGSWLGCQQGASSLGFDLEKLRCAGGPPSLGEGMVGGGEKSFLSFTLGKSVNWSDEKSMTSPNGRGRWLRLEPPPPHAAFKLPLFTHLFPRICESSARSGWRNEHNKFTAPGREWTFADLFLTTEPKTYKRHWHIYLQLLSTTLNPQTLLDIIHLPQIIQRTLGSYRGSCGIFKAGALTWNGFQIISVLVQL